MSESKKKNSKLDSKKVRSVEMPPASSGQASTSSSSSYSLCLLTIGAIAGAASALLWRRLTLDDDEHWWRCDDERASVADGVAGLVGHTPLLRIRSLSEATGCEVRLRFWGSNWLLSQPRQRRNEGGVFECFNFDRPCFFTRPIQPLPQPTSSSFPFP